MSNPLPTYASARVEPPDYLEQLDAYLGYLKGTDYFAGCWESFLDIRRFDAHLDVVARHRALPGTAVLDMGTGTGGLLLACQERGASQLAGVEVNPDLHRLAELRLAGTGIESVLTDGLAVPLPDSSFDIIFSLHVLEHTRSPLMYLSEVVRVLRPDGLVLLACPNRIWPHEVHANLPFITYLPIGLVHRLGRWRSRSTHLPERVQFQFHVATLIEHYFSFFSIRRLCRKVGLVILEVNAPTRFSAQPEILLGAWGEYHPRVLKLLNAINTQIIRRRIEPFVRAHPVSHVAHWLSLLLNWEIYAVLGRASPS